MSEFNDFLNRHQKILEELNHTYIPHPIDPVPLESGDTILAPQIEALKEIAAHTESLKELDAHTDLLDKQVAEIKKQNNLFEEQIAELKKQNEMLERKVKEVDIKGWLAIAIALGSLAVQFLSNYSNITFFFS